MYNYLQKSFLFFLFLCALPQVYAMENNDLSYTTSYITTVNPLLDGTKLKEEKKKYLSPLLYMNYQKKDVNQILAVIQNQNNTNNNSNLLLEYKQPTPENKDCEKNPNKN